ncbi:MAG: M4 family metallopeptidase [Vicinamibacterales bacterium]
MRRVAGAALALAAVVFVVHERGSAQQPSMLPVHATAAAEVRTWDAYISQATRGGALRASQVVRDPALPTHTIERFQQFHEGVRVWGAEAVRDSERGVTQWLFGALSPEPTISVEPRLSLSQARDRVLALAGNGARLLREPELVILPLASGEHQLVFTAVVVGDNTVFRVFVDANSGAEVSRYTEIQTQAAIGSGRGVLGDVKKLSVLRMAGAFVTDDQHRPPVLTTYDMRGDVMRAVEVIFGDRPLFVSDIASDSDNDWTDAVAVDAHAHIGWTYDYFFKRHGRRGLDGRDRSIVAVINGVSQQGALSLPSDLAFLAANAFWCDICGPGGIGLMYFGNGIPPQYVLASTGQNLGYFAGSLDVVAHELTHGVTDSSSGLIYLDESGALNEAFSDIMGTSVEFFHQPMGTGRGEADFIMGEDTVRDMRGAQQHGFRSLSNPGAFGDPDHYSLRYTGPEDNGGVHVNSGIANHAFYLAVVGGPNRTSNLWVQGVGIANREQIEKAFYRAFVFMLPASATFSTARAATIQAARDLYGAGSAPERAVTQAWTAVGVF